MRKVLHGRSLIAGLMMLPITAHAQNQAAIPPAATEAPNNGAAATTDAAPQHPEAVLQDIVVTAERRSVNLQKAPAAITVVDQASLTARGIQDLASAQVLLPSARIGKSAVGTQLFFRGVGQKFDVPNSQPLVATNMSGASVSREALIGSTLFDLARIEALPGPQGTLYGNAAVGGVLNIEFQRPTNQLEVHALVEKGNYASTHIEGAVNLPISDVGGIRLAGNYNYAGAYFVSGAGKVNDLSFRPSIKIAPTDRLSIYAWGMYSQTRGTTPTNDVVPTYVPNIYDDITGSPPIGPGNPVRPFVGENYSNLYLASGEIAYDFGGIKLAYIPSIEKFDGESDFYAGGNAFQIIEHVRQNTNELRLTNDPKSRLKIIAGAYESNQRYLNFVAGSTRGPNSLVPYSRLTDLSAYAQATFDVTDRIRLTGGGRYASDKRYANFTEVLNAGLAGQLGITAGTAVVPNLTPALATQLGVTNSTTPANYLVPKTFAAHYHHADFKVGAEWDITPASMLYGVFQTAYAPGTYSSVPNDPRQTAGVAPSILTAYTVGIKNRFFDRKVTLNVEGYYYNYKNLLVTNNNPIIRTNEFFNAQKIVYEGVEADAAFAFSRFTEAHVAVSYLYARNKLFTVPGVPTAAAPNPPAIDFSGLVPVASPEWTINAGASHSFVFENATKLTFRVDTRFETSSYGGFEIRPGTADSGLSSLNPKFSKTDLSVTLYGRAEKWRVSGWVRNVENTARFSSLSGNSPTSATGFPERPRTYGASVGVDF